MEQDSPTAESGGSHRRDLSGAMVGRYRIESLLGSGGMGEVYRAFDTTLKRVVAIKRMAFAERMDEAFHRRFIREAQNASALNNPRVAAVHDVLEQDREIFLVMEHVEGSTLRARLGSPMPTERFVAIATECAEGIRAAHEKGVVHHDIKPENIMITPAEEVKILDFGVARRLPSGEITATGDARTTDQETTWGGTLTYMAPEVLLGKRSDARADIFSLGLVFFEMLGGRHPFRGETVAATVDNTLHGHPHSLEALNPAVPQQIVKLIERMIARDPHKRPSHAGEVARVLGALQSGRSEGPARQALRFTPSRPGRILALAAVALVIALLAPIAWRALRNRVPAGALPAEKIIAVLPFENLSAGKAGQDLCDGLAMMLPPSLRQMSSDLVVIDGNEVRKRSVDSVDKAVREFRVTLAFTGYFLLAEDRVRLDINLVNAESLNVIESRSEEMPLPNLIRLQEATLPHIARMLRLSRPADLMAAQGASTSKGLELYLRGRGLLRNYDTPGNIDRAIDFFWRATREDGKYADAFAALGEAFWEKYGQTKERQWIERARENCTRALELNGRLPAAYIALGRIRSGTGQTQEALGDFRRALEIDKKNADAYLQMAAAFEKVGMIQDAERNYLKATEILPGDWIGHNQLGGFYFYHERLREAEQQYLRMRDLRPDSAWGYLNLGSVYFKQERWYEARRMFQKSLDISPDTYAYSNLGTLEFQEGRYTDAVTMFRKAFSLDPKNFRLLKNLAGAELRVPGSQSNARGDFEQAARLAEEELKVDPSDAGILAAAADCYSILGARSKALDCLRRALQHQPDNVEIIYAAAQIHEQLGNRKEALQWIEKAIEKGYSRALIERSPALGKLREDPAYTRLAERNKAN